MCCIHTFIVFCQHFICPPVWPGILCCSCISGIVLWLKAEFYEIVKRHLVSCQYCHLLEKFLDDINVFESVYFYKSKFLLSYPVVRGIQKLRSTEIRGGKHIWERTIPYLNLNINFRMWEQITDSVFFFFHFRNLCLLMTSTSGTPEALTLRENAISGFGLLNCRRYFPGK